MEHASESPAGLLEAQLAGLHPQGPGPAQQLTFLTSSQAMLLLLGQETFRDPLVTKLKTEVAKNTDSKSQTTLVQILAPPLMTVNDNYSLCSSFFIFKMGIVVVRYLLHSVVKRTEFIWTKHLEQHLFLGRDHMQVLIKRFDLDDTVVCSMTPIWPAIGKPALVCEPHSPLGFPKVLL